jgi:hypothetical protein
VCNVIDRAQVIGHCKYQHFFLPDHSRPVDEQQQLVLIGQRIIAAEKAREMGKENIPIVGGTLRCILY